MDNANTITDMAKVCFSSFDEGMNLPFRENFLETVSSFMHEITNGVYAHVYLSLG